MAEGAAEPSAANAFMAEHAALLSGSLHRWSGAFLPGAEKVDAAVAQAIFTAPFALVSHGVETDPVFNYGNRTALELFEMGWADFVALPSRCSAEPVDRAERAQLMERVSDQGFIDDYAGVRVSSRGRRFYIERATVWNLVDEQGSYRGQAALFDRWQYL